MWDRRRYRVELLDGKAPGSFVAGHELGALLGRDDVINDVERAAATFIDDIEQPEWPGAAPAMIAKSFVTYCARSVSLIAVPGDFRRRSKL